MSERMSDERLARMEIIWFTNDDALFEELLVALVAERAKVRELEVKVARLRAALERIADMCGDRFKCICGIPTGVGAVKACAEKALQEPSEVSDA